jgi:hypothetical protein
LKPLEKTTLVSQLSMIASMLTEFASTQFLFLSLTKEDQVSISLTHLHLLYGSCKNAISSKNEESLYELQLSKVVM